VSKQKCSLRERVGRPRVEDEVQKRRNISLSNRLAEKARKLGNGNISEGLRRALESAND
jgi:hypothetical protein